MQIELSQDEVATISEALETWEKDSGSGALMSSLLSAMILGKDGQSDEHKRKEEAKFKKAEEEAKSRKLKSVMLRAKLMQAGITLLTGQTAQ